MPRGLGTLRHNGPDFLVHVAQEIHVGKVGVGRRGPVLAKVMLKQVTKGLGKGKDM